MSQAQLNEVIVQVDALRDMVARGYIKRTSPEQKAMLVLACELDKQSDLLEALKYAVDNPEFNSEAFDRIARAAILKAEGEQK